MTIRPKWLKDLCSVLFSFYYLLWANEGDEVVSLLACMHAPTPYAAMREFASRRLGQTELANITFPSVVEEIQSALYC